MKTAVARNNVHWLRASLKEKRKWQQGHIQHEYFTISSHILQQLEVF